MTMQYGARAGKLNFLKRLTAQAGAYNLHAFVVPAAEYARTCGLDLPAAGLQLVATPRQASVMVVLGELPEGLARATAVVYAQMLRPRAILAIGTKQLLFLPAPAVQVEFDQEQLQAGVKQLRHIFATNSWLAETTKFTLPDDLTAQNEEAGSQPDHSMHGMGHGSVSMHEMNHPRAAPDDTAMMGQEVAQSSSEPSHMRQEKDSRHDETAAIEPQDHNAPAPEHAMAAMDHNNHDMATMEQSGHDMTGMSHDMATMEHSGHDMAGMGHDMAGMGHDGGFMSMVAMTRDVPRSRDGLPMEWVETPFGPLFPGLSAGLGLTFTLDGEAVAGVEVAEGITGRGLTHYWPGPVETFPERLARLNPLTPLVYRVLALQALEQAAGSNYEVQEEVALARLGAIERERAISHLGWLARLSELLGVSSLSTQAARLQIRLARSAKVAEVNLLRPQVTRLVGQWRTTPFLKRRLTGLGRISFHTGEYESWPGPVARASGEAEDVRRGDPIYEKLAFKPTRYDGGDTLARLEVHLVELEQSLNLLAAATSLTLPSTPLALPHLVGPVTGQAAIETPRGKASLQVDIVHNQITGVRLITPSSAHRKLLKPLSQGQDFADALLIVASLDLSAWELDQ